MDIFRIFHLQCARRLPVLPDLSAVRVMETHDPGCVYRGESGSRG